MNAVELLQQKKATVAFIRAQAITVSLVRTPESLPNERAGVEPQTPIILAEQTFRILHDSPTTRSNTLNSPGAGRIPSTRDQLLGAYNVDVKVGDTFENDGVEYEVTWVDPHREYQTISNLRMLEQRKYA